MTSSIAIIGAGMAGLTAAGALTARGFPVVLLEKSRGVGGRMSTKRTDTGLFDQGAQFLTARALPFVGMVEAWTTAGVLRRWPPDLGGVRPEETRYIGVPTMTAIPKHLASTLQVLLQRKVQRLERRGRNWLIYSQDGSSHESGALVLTAPLPQSLQILESSGLSLAAGLSEELRTITYNACIALMASLEGPTAVPGPGGLPLGPEPVRWIADNHQKGIQTPRGTLTIHAGPEFSQAHYRDAEDTVTRLLLDAVAPYLGSSVVFTLLHRWRYSEPCSTLKHSAVLAVEDPPLILAGDSFGGPSVEGAALSGLAAADLLASHIQGCTR